MKQTIESIQIFTVEGGHLLVPSSQEIIQILENELDTPFPPTQTKVGQGMPQAGYLSRNYSSECQLPQKLGNSKVEIFGYVNSSMGVL